MIAPYEGFGLTMMMTSVVTAQDASASAVARKAMIDSQLRPSGVNDPRILAIMAQVPREDFVPEAARAAAYIDRAVPLGEGRWLAAPLVHGLMLGEAQPTKRDTVLLVGDGKGYLAALLAPLAGSVDAVTPAEVAEKAGAYSLILIDGAVEEPPAALVSLLADDGRIVTGLVTRGVTRLAVGRKAAGEIALLPLAEIGIPVLPEFAAPKRWSF